MEPGNVDSHIQMPRFLLARFENEQHKFFYYDVKKRFIGTNGHAKSTNTEYGYYPNEIEELLNNELEQPFSRILQFIDCQGQRDQEIQFPGFCIWQGQRWHLYPCPPEVAEESQG